MHNKTTRTTKWSCALPTPWWLRGLRIRCRSSPSVIDRAIVRSALLSPSASHGEEPLVSPAGLVSPVSTSVVPWCIGLPLGLLNTWKILWLLQVSRLLEEGEVVRLSESRSAASCSCNAHANDSTGQTTDFFFCAPPGNVEVLASPQTGPSTVSAGHRERHDIYI